MDKRKKRQPKDASLVKVDPKHPLSHNWFKIICAVCVTIIIIVFVLPPFKKIVGQSTHSDLISYAKWLGGKFAEWGSFAGMGYAFRPYIEKNFKS